MTPLLEALVAAVKAGFDAPKCATCQGSKTILPYCHQCAYSLGRHQCPSREDCAYCHATGLDASDPERLIGRALLALLPIEPQFKRHGILRDPVIHLGDPDCPATVSGHHDGTPTSLATAILRLIARVGAPKATTPPRAD